MSETIRLLLDATNEGSIHWNRVAEQKFMTTFNGTEYTISGGPPIRDFIKGVDHDGQADWKALKLRIRLGNATLGPVELKSQGSPVEVEPGHHEGGSPSLHRLWERVLQQHPDLND